MASTFFYQADSIPRHLETQIFDMSLSKEWLLDIKLKPVIFKIFLEIVLVYLSDWTNHP